MSQKQAGLTLRLCYVYLWPILPEKGEFATVVPIRQAWLSKGTDTGVFVLFSGALDVAKLAENGIAGHSFGRHGPALVRHGSLIRQQVWLARRERIDVFMNVWAHYDLIPLWLGARLSGAKLIARVAGVPIGAAPLPKDASPSRRLRRWLGLRLEKLSLSVADGVCALSHSLKRILVERGVAADKVFVVPQGVDTTLFRPPATQKRVTDGETILFVGRLTAVKDLPTALRAFRLVKEELPGARFVIVGAGEQREELGQLTISLQLADSVVFKGFVPHDRLASEYAHADLFLLPSLSEGLPNTVLEAQACGLPVVATAVGENPYLLTDERGYLVPPGDFEEMAAGIIRLLQDEKTRRDMGARARAFVEANYSFEAVRLAHQRLFEAVLGPRKGW